MLRTLFCSFPSPHSEFLPPQPRKSVCCFPGGSDGKESACNAGDPSLIPGLGRSLGEGNGNPFQYACLENSMDRGAWQVTVHGITESDMTDRLSLFF